MAITDIRFKIQGESPLPGGGFDASGIPVQAKKMVWGRIEVLSYAAAGMDMSLNDIHLSALDFIEMQVYSLDDDDDGVFTYPQSTVHYDAQWADGTDKLFITLSEKSGTAVTDEGVVNINFFAICDSSTIPVLL